MARTLKTRRATGYVVISREQLGAAIEGPSSAPPTDLLEESLTRSRKGWSALKGMRGQRLSDRGKQPKRTTLPPFPPTLALVYNT